MQFKFPTIYFNQEFPAVEMRVLKKVQEHKHGETAQRLYI